MFSLTELISNFSAHSSEILLSIGLIFVFLKIVDKILQKPAYKVYYEKVKLPFYYLHIICITLAVILAFLHGIIIKPLNNSYIVTGLLFGIILLISSGLGVILAFKGYWRPFNDEKDSELRNIRIIKWILTISAFISLLMHYFWI